MWVNPNHPRYDELTGRQSRPEVATAEPPKETGERLATLPRSTRGGAEEELRIDLASFKGHAYVSVRVWVQDKTSGNWFPTRKGCSVKLAEIDDVREALATAQRLTDRRRSSPPRKETPAVREQRGSTQAPPPSSREFSEFEGGESPEGMP